MINIVSTIAFNTFRENIRDKILYSILMFGFGFALISSLISQWSLDQWARLMLDFGMAIISIFGLFIAIFIGIGLVSKEIEKRTIYFVLSKQISRSMFLIGKYFGLVMTLFIVFVLMSVGFIGVYVFFQGMVNVGVFVPIGMSFFQMCIMVAVALTFSTFATPMVSAILSLFVYIGGFFSADYMLLGPGTSNPVIQWFMKIIYYIMPNMSLLNFRSHIVHDLPIEGANLLLGALYAIAYSVILLVCASVIFKNRSLK